MQAEERKPDAVAAPQRHDYFQLLQALRERGVIARAQSDLSLAFPLSDVAACDGRAVRPAFMGLLGSAGALPYHYTERIAAATDDGPRAFLDMLSARALEQFDAAWRKNRPSREARAGMLMALGGGCDPALAQYAAQARRPVASAAAIGRALSQYFGMAVRVEQFVGNWQALAPQHQNALGMSNATLGNDAALGVRQWRCDARIRVHIGPLGSDDYRDFQPRGAGALALARMVGGLLGGGEGSTGDTEVCVHLAGACVWGARLDGGAQLGYNAFVLTSEENEARSELRYQL
jgi:type VI secretion system protein ImpH